MRTRGIGCERARVVGGARRARWRRRGGTREDLETRSPKIGGRGGAMEGCARDARDGERVWTSKRALGMRCVRF